MSSKESRLLEVMLGDNALTMGRECEGSICLAGGMEKRGDHAHCGGVGKRAGKRGAGGGGWRGGGGAGVRDRWGRRDVLGIAGQSRVTWW